MFVNIVRMCHNYMKPQRKKLIGLHTCNAYVITPTEVYDVHHENHNQFLDLYLGIFNLSCIKLRVVVTCIT